MSITTTDDESPCTAPSRQLAAQGKAITPESFQIELEAVRGGYGQNVCRARGGWGVNQDWLVLWPRDTPVGGEPFLIDPACLPRNARQAAWLAQFTFSYDPARYAPVPPVRLRGMARVRPFMESLRPTTTAPVPYRASFPSRSPQEPQEAEEEPPEDDEAA